MSDLISREVLKGLISDKSIPIKFEEEKRGNWQNASGLLLCDIYKIIDNAPTISPYKAIHDELHKGEEYMDEDAKQASLPYTYNAPQHDWKCGYPDITGGKEE